jgi:tetratricopeptide (TPR) repeat protein
MCGHPERALPVLQRLIEMHPDFDSGRQRLANTYVQLGHFQEAIALYRSVLARSPERCATKGLLAYALAADGQLNDAQALAAAVEGERSDRIGGCPYQAAIAQTGLRHADRAFADLELAFEAHDDLSTLLVDPHFVAYRADPRFQSLLRRTGLAQYSSEPVRSASR